MSERIRPPPGRRRSRCSVRPSSSAHGTEPKAGASGLVEEALLDESRALLRRDLDVARREQEDLVGDLLHPAVERVGEPGGEVDEALGEVAVDALEVDD